MKYTKFDEVRFWNKVRVGVNQASCWYWKASTHNFGYGTFRINGKTYLAHKLALFFWTGEDKSDIKQVNHSCNNPACCNPNHLYWGTPKENTKDAIKSGRFRNPPVFHGEEHPNAILNNDKVRMIRSQRASGRRVIEIARELGVSEQTIYRVVNFDYWKEVI
jgi:hypothetical protein